MAFIFLFFDYKEHIEKGREEKFQIFGTALKRATINFWSFFFALLIYIIISLMYYKIF